MSPPRRHDSADSRSRRAVASLPVAFAMRMSEVRRVFLQLGMRRDRIVVVEFVGVVAAAWRSVVIDALPAEPAHRGRPRDRVRIKALAFGEEFCPELPHPPRVAPSVSHGSTSSASVSRTWRRAESGVSTSVTGRSQNGGRGASPSGASPIPGRAKTPANDRGSQVFGRTVRLTERIADSQAELQHCDSTSSTSLGLRIRRISHRSHSSGRQPGLVGVMRPRECHTWIR